MGSVMTLDQDQSFSYFETQQASVTGMCKGLKGNLLIVVKTLATLLQAQWILDQ